MIGKTVVAALAAATAVQANPMHNFCHEVSFDVYAQAYNRDLSGLNLSDPNLLQILAQDAFTRVPVNGTQKIAGVYCEAAVKNANNNRLQFLSHGITSNRAYWSALGGSLGGAPYKPELYSWDMYAINQGFPILAIDRLGAGRSSHPDPTLVTQGPYEYALYDALTQKIKSGTAVGIPRAFKDVIYVGHSYGSEVGASMAQLYPNDFSQIVLTGFSKSVQPSLPGVSLQLPVPAAVHDPARFGGLNPGYLTASSQQGRINSFFGTRSGIDYDPAFNSLFYDREDVVSTGQFVTTYIGNQPAPAYKGRVLVLTGNKDQAFCGPGSPVLGPADCSALVPQTASLFPNAEYNYKLIPNTGHAVNLHYTSLQSFKAAHDFLNGARFAG